MRWVVGGRGSLSAGGGRRRRTFLAFTVLLSVLVVASLFYDSEQFSLILPRTGGSGIRSGTLTSNNNNNNSNNNTLHRTTTPMEYQPRSDALYVSQLKAILEQQHRHESNESRGGAGLLLLSSSNKDCSNNVTQKSKADDSDATATPAAIQQSTIINCKQARMPGTHAPAHLDQCAALAPLVERGIVAVVSHLVVIAGPGPPEQQNYTLGKTVLRFDRHSQSLLQPRLAGHCTGCIARPCTAGVCQHALAIFEERNETGATVTGKTNDDNSTRTTTQNESVVLFPSGFNHRSPSLAVFSDACADLQSGRIHIIATAPPAGEAGAAPNDDCRRTRFFRNGGSGSSNRTLPAATTTTTSSSSYNCVVQFQNCYGAPNPRSLPDDSWKKRRAIPRFDTAIMLSDSYSRGFFHLMVEQLTRLLLLRDFLATQDDSSSSSIAIVVQDDSHRTGPLFRDLVRQLLGESVARRIATIYFSKRTQPQRRWIHARQLLVPEPTPCGNVQPAQAHDTRTAIQAALEAAASSSEFYPSGPQQDDDDDDGGGADIDERRKSIVVVRRRQSRVIVNHDELVESIRAALPHERIVVFDEAHLPPPGLDQWAIFHRAKVVVAPHGAGLANLLACAPETAVVEFLGVGKDFNPCFWLLATSAGLEYHPVAMVPPPAQRRERRFRRGIFPWRKRGSRYTVDVPHATEIVVEIVQQRYKRKKADGR